MTSVTLKSPSFLFSLAFSFANNGTAKSTIITLKLATSNDFMLLKDIQILKFAAKIVIKQWKFSNF